MISNSSCFCSLSQIAMLVVPMLTSRGHYVGIHTSNFRDFILKPEILRAVVDCGFEHPSEGEFGLQPYFLLLQV